MKYLVLALTLLNVGCLGCAARNVSPVFQSSSPVCVSLESDDSRLDILSIGGSESVGYYKLVEAHMPGYQVTHTPCQAMSSANGVNKVDAWLSERPVFKAVIFNFGMDDLNTSDSDYAQNLHIIAQKIKAKTSRPLYILTTSSVLSDVRVKELNQIAGLVMAQEGIPVFDLYSVSNEPWATRSGSEFSAYSLEVFSQYIRTQLYGLGL